MPKIMYKIKNNKVLGNRLDLVVITINILMLAVITVPNIKYCTSPAILFDEFGYWASGALFAGYDWSGIASTLCPYYSYGYGFALGILIRVTKSMSIAYQLAVGLNIIMLGAMVILANLIVKQMRKDVNKNEIAIACLIMSLYPGYLSQIYVAWTETCLAFVYMLSVFFLCKFVNTNKKRYGFFFASCLIFLYMIHQRSIGVVFAGILVICIIGWHKKISWKMFFIYFMFMGGLLIIHILIKENLYINLWENSEGNLLQDLNKLQNTQNINVISNVLNVNDYSGVLSKVFQMFSIEGIKKLIFSLAGKIYYMGAATLFFSFEGIVYLYEIIKKAILKNKEDRAYSNSASIAIYIITSAILTLMISAIFMLESERIDSIIYGRYTEWCIGILIVFGFLNVCEKRCLYRRALIYSAMQLSFGIILYKYIIKRSVWTFYEVCAPVFYYFYEKYWNNLEWVLVAVMVFAILSGICLCFLRTKSGKINMFIVLLIAIVNITFAIPVRDRVQVLRNCEEIYQVAKTVETCGEKNIYFIYDLRDGEKEGYGQSNYYIGAVQFMISDRTIYCLSYTQLEMINEGIIIAPSYEVDETLYNLSYQKVDQTKNYQVFVK